MRDIDLLYNKLNMLYNNCVILSNKSCICQDNIGIYRLYTLDKNNTERYSSYTEFVKLTKDFNKYKCTNSKLYGICDNIGKDVQNIKYEDITSIKENKIIVKEIGLNYGLLNLVTKEKILDCKYSNISMYREVEFIVTQLNYFGVSEIYNYAGERLLNARYNYVILTNRLIICCIDEMSNHLYELYDYDLKLIGACTEQFNISNKDGLVDIEAEIDGKIRHWKNLKIKEEIEKKEGLSI